MGKFIPGDSRGLSGTVCCSEHAEPSAETCGKAAQAHSNNTPVQLMATWTASSSTCVVAMPVALGANPIGAQQLWVEVVCFVSINCAPCTWVAVGTRRRHWDEDRGKEMLKEQVMC